MKQKLLKLFKENGDNSLFAELQKEYGGLVVYYAQKIHAKTKVYGEEMDDCIQQCWICFLKAVKNYDINSGHTFAAFLVSCLTNYMINHIRDYVRKRGKVNIISIDNYIIEDDSVSYLELFESDYNSPAYDYELKEVLEKYNIPQDAFVISYVGRHNSVKGYDKLKEIGKKIFFIPLLYGLGVFP